MSVAILPPARLLGHLWGRGGNAAITLLRPPYCSVNGAVPVPDELPSVQVTVACPVPGIFEPFVQVQDTVPSAPAVCVVCRACAVERVPEAYITETVHCAPAVVVACTVVAVPAAVGSGLTVTRTASVPVDGAGAVVGVLRGGVAEAGAPVGTAPAPPPGHVIVSTGCSSIPLGATPD